MQLGIPLETLSGKLDHRMRQSIKTQMLSLYCSELNILYAQTLINVSGVNDKVVASKQAALTELVIAQ